MRFGIGYDIHALVAGRKLILGGVLIPSPKGLKGHSDGDVLLHAIVDAALGAAGMGDIGELFPDSDRRWKGADSSLFVTETLRRLKTAGLAVSNIDSVVIAEKPKLSSFKEKIRRKIAGQFKIDPSRVSIKAKTHEGFGAIGEGRAIACTAVVALKSLARRKK